MPDTTQQTLDLPRLRERHEAARLELELRQLAAAAGAPLLEEWGEVVDRRELFADDPAFGFSGLAPFSSLDDRQQGQFRPVYATEQELAAIRGAARGLARLTPVAAGAVEALANYVLGSGFTFRAHAASGGTESEALAQSVQRVLDEFVDDNEFQGGLDREAHQRSREDGEAFLVLAPRPGGRVRVRFVEPDQITEPANPRPLEDWLGTAEEFASCWRFGIHTRQAETDRPLGYHVVYDGSGRDWDYVPAGRLEHLKRNVSRNAKRGVSDFFPIQGDLEREAKLRRNTAEGAALQAAIAWILQPPAGTTQPQLQALGAGDVFTRYTKPVVGGTKTQSVQRYAPGTILKPSPGLEYKPGPMGSERNPNFVIVAQYVLRAIGVRWNMPEYLISGDASNANYASTLVAESPFVKAREADQQFYKRHFHSLAWKALRLAWESGRFSARGWPWTVIENQIDIQVVVPTVASRDPLKLAQTQELQIRLGLLSRRTAAAQASLDYDAEVRNGAVPAGQRGEPPP